MMFLWVCACFGGGFGLFFFPLGKGEPQCLALRARSGAAGGRAPGPRSARVPWGDSPGTALPVSACAYVYHIAVQIKQRTLPPPLCFISVLTASFKADFSLRALGGSCALGFSAFQINECFGEATHLALFSFLLRGEFYLSPPAAAAKR